MMKKEEIKAFILASYLRKPYSQTEDLIKLLYQSFFGAKHLLDNKEKALDSLRKEKTIANGGEIEELLNGYVRYPVSMIKDVDSFFSIFALQEFVDPKHIDFLFSLNTLKEMLETKEIDLDIKVLDSYMNSDPLKPISHSEIYVKKYDPHYRVIPKNLIDKL